MHLPESVMINSVKLDEPEIQRILDQLDLVEEEGEKAEQRGAPRRLYRVRGVVVHVNQSGMEVSFLVPVRNISKTGLAFLHRQMLHVNTPCRVEMVLPDGASTNVRAQVAHCRHVQGVVHEIGLQFDRSLQLPE